jgi:hypothetical protein
MAIQYKWGVCTNMDHDGEGTPCPLCLSKEKQKIIGTHDFVCRECGEDLTPVQGTSPTKWPLYAGIGVAALAVLGGGGYGIYALMKSPTPKDIVLNHTEKTLFVGDKDTLHATINPEGCEGTLTWKASKDGTLSVTSDGIVTAEQVGTGKVRVLLEGADGIKAVCEYKIKAKAKDTIIVEPPVKVEGVTTNTATATLKVGATQQLTATVSPSDSKATVTWVSSNESVAMVSSTGLVKALKAGKAVITAKAGDKTAIVTITIGTDTPPEIPTRPVLGGRATYNAKMQVIYIKRTVTMSLHGADNESITLYPGDKIVGAKVQNGYLKQGEFIVRGESTFCSGLNNKIY